MEVAYDADEMDADGDGVLDEHTWDQIRAKGREEPVSTSPKIVAHIHHQKEVAHPCSR